MLRALRLPSPRASVTAVPPRPGPACSPDLRPSSASQLEGSLNNQTPSFRVASHGASRQPCRPRPSPPPEGPLPRRPSGPSFPRSSAAASLGHVPVSPQRRGRARAMGMSHAAPREASCPQEVPGETPGNGTEVPGERRAGWGRGSRQSPPGQVMGRRQLTLAQADPLRAATFSAGGGRVVLSSESTALCKTVRRGCRGKSSSRARRPGTR